MRNAVVAVALLVAFCAPREGAKAPAPKPAAAAAKAAAPNLLSMTAGAAVVSRTAEALLDASAVRAIDTDPGTMWVSPPDDPKQTLIFSLPGRANITAVGIRKGLRPELRPVAVQIDASLDGQTFTPLTTIKPSKGDAPDIVRVLPAEAAFLRFSVLGGQDRYVQIAEVEADGAQIGVPPLPSLNGCYSVNGAAASFVQNGSDVAGEVALGSQTTVLEGGSDGHFFRFAWIRGKEYGLAAISVTPDGQHLSGIVWHEEAIQQTQFMAPDWLGDRAACEHPSAPSASVFRSYLQREHRFPLYGLRFDPSGRLHEEDSAATLSRVTAFLSANPRLPVRFVAHELLHSTPDENRRIAQARVDSLRAALLKNGVNLANVTFLAPGADTPHRQATTTLTRAMYSSLDLEVAVAR